MEWLWKFLKGTEHLYPAIDIGTSSVKLVKTEKIGNSYKVKAHGKKEYREQVFAGTEIIDEFELVRAITNLVTQLKIKDKEVAIHVPQNSCFYSVLSVPATKEPEQAVSEYMQTIISPEELPHVKIDYKVLPISVEKGHIDIAVAAVKKEVIDKRVKIIRQAGLTPAVIDIEPAAINNQFYLNHPENTAIPVCLIDIGAAFTKVVISFGGYPYIIRTIETGGIALTEQIQKEFMLSFEDAERLKRGEAVKELSYQQIVPIVGEFLKKIATEALWTIENFMDRYNIAVEEIYLYGGTAKLQDADSMFQEFSNKKTYKGEPLLFSGIPGNEEFAVSAGLSLRYKGDHNAKV